MGDLDWKSELCVSCGFYEPHLLENDGLPGWCHSEEQREHMGYERRLWKMRACPAYKPEADPYAIANYLQHFLKRLIWENQ